MSWIERIKTDFTITTGDGATYVPNMVNASKNVEYNIGRFEFPGTPGSLIKRGTPRGTQYAIELFFQGEDHLDTASSFQESAADPRPWTIAHPMYGSILVQPISLTFDNAILNVTRISGVIIETIPEAPGTPVVSAPDAILSGKVNTDAALAQNLSVVVPEPSASDLQTMITDAAGAYNAALASIHNPGNIQDFVNAYNLANSAITAVTSNTLNTFTRLQTFYSLPLTFSDTVTTRIAMLTNMLGFVNGQVRDDMTRSQKFIYEATTGTIMTSILATIATGTARAFSTRRQTLNTLGQITSAYNQYLQILDDIQTATGDLLTSFIPSLEPLRLMGNLASLATTTLLNIADTARQERIYELPTDSNVILLAHQLAGLKQDDSTISELIEVNVFGFYDLLGLQKGRRITYLV